MLKFSKPVIILLGAIFLGVTGRFLYFINSTISDVLLLIAVAAGFFSCIFIIAGKTNPKKDKYVITILVVAVIVLNFLLRSFFWENSVRLYIFYNKTELQQIQRILINRNSEISVGEDKIGYHGSVLSIAEEREVSDLKDIINCNWVFADSNKIGYQIKNSLIIVYSETPIEGCFYDIKVKEYIFKTSKLYGNWYYFHLASWR